MSTPDSGDNPLISICMTAYRRPTMMVQALLACTLQDYRPLEIDISDDSPNEHTEHAVRSVPLPSDITLRYRRNHPSLGEPQNVNSLFAEARGRYTVLMHDDDLLLPGAVTALYNALRSSPGAVAAFGIQQVINGNGELGREETEYLNRFYRRDPSYAGVLADPLLCALRRQFPNNGYLIETEVARAIQYREHADIGRAGDTDFGIRLGLLFPDRAFVFIAEPTSQYRITEGSSRTMDGIAWKLYDSLDHLGDLNPSQAEARLELMQRLSDPALVDNAISGRRRRALRIFLSSTYSARSSLSKAAYHLSLIAFPRLHGVKRFVRSRQPEIPAHIKDRRNNDRRNGKPAIPKPAPH